MPTINTILKELKNIPVDRLEDLYSIVHSLQSNTKLPDNNSKKILSFAGSFRDLTESEYEDFQKQTTNARNHLIDRDTTL